MQLILIRQLVKSQKIEDAEEYAQKISEQSSAAAASRTYLAIADYFRGKRQGLLGLPFVKRAMPYFQKMMVGVDPKSLTWSDLNTILNLGAMSRDEGDVETALTFLKQYKMLKVLVVIGLVGLCLVKHNRMSLQSAGMSEARKMFKELKSNSDKSTAIAAIHYGEMLLYKLGEEKRAIEVLTDAIKDTRIADWQRIRPALAVGKWLSNAESVRKRWHGTP